MVEKQNEKKFGNPKKIGLGLSFCILSHFFSVAQKTMAFSHNSAFLLVVELTQIPFPLPGVGCILRRGQDCSHTATEHLLVLFTDLIKWKIIRSGKMTINSWSILSVSSVCGKSITKLVS